MFQGVPGVAVLQTSSLLEGPRVEPEALAQQGGTLFIRCAAGTTGGKGAKPQNVGSLLESFTSNHSHHKGSWRQVLACPCRACSLQEPNSGARTTVGQLTSACCCSQHLSLTIQAHRPRPAKQAASKHCAVTVHLFACAQSDTAVPPIAHRVSPAAWNCPAWGWCPPA